MRKCVICNHRYQKGSQTAFHRFPVDSTLRNIWLYNMKAVNWTPKELDTLCSKHFDNKCFIKHYNRTTLKLGSVPTIFEGLCEDPKFYKAVKIADTNDKVSEEKGMEMEEAQLLMQNNSNSSSSVLKHQSQKQCGIKRLLSENIWGENKFHLNPSATDKSAKDLQDKAKINKEQQINRFTDFLINWNS